MNDQSIEEQIKSMNLSDLKGVIFDFVVPLILLIVTALLGFLYIKPTYKQMGEISADVSAKQELVSVLTYKTAALTKMKDFGSVLKENADLMSALLPTDSNVPQLLDEVAQISANAGMALDRLSYSYAAPQGQAAGVSEPTKQDDKGLVQVAMTSTGSYDQLVVFMESIENAARLADVTDFRLGVDEVSALSANINIDSPYMAVQSNAVTDDPVTLDISSQGFVNFINRAKTFKIYTFTNTVIPTAEETVEKTTTEESTTPLSTTEPVTETETSTVTQ